MIDPKIKNDEVILLDSDQSPSEVHVDESKKRKTKKRGKDVMGARKPRGRKSITFEQLL